MYFFKNFWDALHVKVCFVSNSLSLIALTAVADIMM